MEFSLAETKNWFQENKGVLMGLGIAALGLASCDVDITQLTPDNLGSGWWGDVQQVMSAWGGTVGFGLLTGFINGAWTFNVVKDAWENKESYIKQAEKVEDTIEEMINTLSFNGQKISQAQADAQAKHMQRQANDIRKSVNPLYMTKEVVKEGLEGFIAGSIGQVTMQEAFTPGSDIVKTALLTWASFNLFWQAFNKRKI
jgi:hypothetical protein